MKTSKNLPADLKRRKDEVCFGTNPFIFQSEVEAIRSMLPEGYNLRGIDISLGTGRFTQALGIGEGVESPDISRALSSRRGRKVIDSVVEPLPYKNLSFDFVLMILCIRCFNDLHVAFKEAYRVLRKNGVLVTGFIDRGSILGKKRELRENQYSKTIEVEFFAVDKVIFELNLAEFKEFNICQTLFYNDEDKIEKFQPAKPGYGEGSFVVIQARKECDS